MKETTELIMSIIFMGLSLIMLVLMIYFMIDTFGGILK